MMSEAVAVEIIKTVLYFDCSVKSLGKCNLYLNCLRSVCFIMLYFQAAIMGKYTYLVVFYVDIFCLLVVIVNTV